MDSELSKLIDDGFDVSAATHALNRCNGNYNQAKEMLRSGLQFDEFDLLAQAAPGPEVAPRSVPASNTHEDDDYRTGKETSVAEIVDARIATFAEMGFTAKESEWALEQCGNDINEALNLLLSGKTS